MGIETVGSWTTQKEKTNYSEELLDSFSRKWESRKDLLDLVLKYIKVKDYTIDNVNQMITQNYEWTDLCGSIKDTAGNKHWRKWRKNIKNTKSLKSQIFPFEITDEQFCNFLFLSNPWNYYLDKITINFWSKHEGLKQQLEEKNKEIEKKRIDLEQQYQSKLLWTNVFDHRRISEDCKYYAAQDEKEKFINNWLQDLNIEKEKIEADIKNEQNNFYAEYPYLKTKNQLNMK